LLRAEVYKTQTTRFPKGIYFIDFQSLSGKKSQVKWVVD